MERKIGQPEPTEKIFWRQVFEMETLIENKYQSRKPLNEARKDALIYAASQLSWYKIDALIHPDLDQEEVEESAKEAIQWENAIERAKNNDWTAMRTTLQDYARSASRSSTIRESLHEINSQIAPGNEDQRRADALVNLISSL